MTNNVLPVAPQPPECRDWFVVVYKVDRLTRSLSDFARMVEIFDGYKVSFFAAAGE